MTNDQIAAKLDDLSSTLRTEFARIDSKFTNIDAQFEKIDAEFDKVNTRLDQTVTKSDVNGAVMQGLAFAAAAIVGTVVVLNAIGAFS